MITINTNSNNNCSFIICQAPGCPLKVCLIESYSNLNVATHKNLRTSSHLLLMELESPHDINHSHLTVRSKLYLSVSISTHKCVLCVLAFARVWTHTGANACGGLRYMLEIILNPYDTLFIEAVSLNQTQHPWTWLLTLGIPTSVFWGIELQVDSMPTWHLHGSWESSHLHGKHLNHWAISQEQVVVILKASMAPSPEPNSPMELKWQKTESPSRLWLGELKGKTRCFLLLLKN